MKRFLNDVAILVVPVVVFYGIVFLLAHAYEFSVGRPGDSRVGAWIVALAGVPALVVLIRLGGLSPQREGYDEWV
jgi:hypothetical protein